MLVCLVLLARFRAFVLDDAFIAFRFSEHLAAGRGLVWNLGEQPIEGFSSMSWVLMNALAIASGLDPVSFSKLVSALSTLAIVLALALASRQTDRALSLVWTGGVAFSPLFAFLAMQGLETAFAALLLLGAAHFALETCEKASWRRVAGLQGAAFLAALTRPESVAFLVGLEVGLLVRSVLGRDLAAVRRLAISGAGVSVPALAYMYWRISYFGQVLPNAFYVKVDRGTGWFKPEGIDYVVTFVLQVALPFLLLALALFVARWREGRGWRTLSSVAPILFGTLLHAIVLLTLVPIQGFFWRYAMPVLPALLYAFSRSCGRLPFERAGRWRIALASLMVLSIALWNLRFLPETGFQERRRAQHDRVAVGRALAGTRGVMLTTAAGALPFYSGWQAEDDLGIVSRAVARDGLSLAHLSGLDPDLVAMRPLRPGPLAFELPSHLVVGRYVRRRGFVVVAAIERSFGYSLFLLVRQDSPLFGELVRRLTHISGVRYGDLEALTAGSGIPILGASLEAQTPENPLQFARPSPGSRPESE